ncbi:ATPase, AAA family [hydrothermal vent metagenome]|uniref:ATPase, AAA family n=1 Tax=hydrothermal vent metagenome TaxID=652676 RepID=A0A3B0V3S4_9ZZZZ
MVDTVEAKFTSSLQHILAELTRLDLLIRVQVWRLRQARDSDVNLSPFYIPEEEIDVILDKEMGAPPWATAPLPPELLQDIQERLTSMTAVIQQQKQATTIPLRLIELGKRFHLSLLDLDILLIALAPEIDLRYARLYAYLQDNVSQKHPSVNLTLSLLLPNLKDKLAAHQRFTANAPLRQHQLLHLITDPATPHPSWLDQGVTLDSRIVRYLLDGDEANGRLAPYLTLKKPTIELDNLLLPPHFAPRLTGLLQQENLILYFQGTYGVGKQTTAAALCQHIGQRLLVINGEQLLKSVKAEAFPNLVQLADREARLQGAALFWDGFDSLLADDKRPQRHAFFNMLANRPGITYLSGNQIWEPDHTLGLPSFFRIQFPRPSYEERHTLWTGMLAELEPAEAKSSANGTPPIDTEALATTFRFSAGQIHDSAQTARNLARWRNPDAPHLQESDLYTASRLHSNRKLAELAQKIEPHYKWDDIVLPADRIEQLRAICDQMKYRGRVYHQWGFDDKLAMGKGINALFAGPPGTGKTMSADIIAHELGLALYKIDLSSVVSKFIGETEKNLSRIFSEAETSNAILFFDEADALFGKRTEVRDSHDRYANLEISYLLQKMEEYDGVVILATNLHKNMDDAFRRRMHFIIEFPLPDETQRRRIWAQIWPVETPRSPDLDLDFIAQQVVVSGGNIRNIALAAAFLAAADGQTVTMPHLIKATQREYQKIGKLLSGQEFAAYEEEDE